MEAASLNQERVSVPRSPLHGGLVVLQTCMAAYRDAFVDELLARRPDARLFTGSEYFDPTVVLSSHIALRCQRLPNHFILGRRALWQSGAFAAASRAGTLVLEGNPRIVSSWPLLAFRKATGRPSFLWGHAWPRTGRESRSRFLRRWMLRLGNGALVYTPADAAELAEVTGKPIFVAANATMSRRIRPTTAGPARDVLQIGRLVAAKKPLLTLEAWALARPDLPPAARLVFVGDGPLRDTVVRRAAELGVADRVDVVGSVHDPDGLARHFGAALLTVCAGYAGLSLTQSLSYGVPVAVAREEPHAPEVSLADDSNSRWFPSDDSAALAGLITGVYAERGDWLARRPGIAERTLAVYSVEAMVDAFMAASRV